MYIYRYTDAGHREVMDYFLQHLTSAPQPFFHCTQGTVHQAWAGETVGLPQAGSSTHHPSSGAVRMPKNHKHAAPLLAIHK